MVGVPSSKGCSGCRRAKKKCIVEHDNPPCARCAKLQIDCVGYGVRRLKFQDETNKFTLIHRGNSPKTQANYSSHGQEDSVTRFAGLTSNRCTPADQIGPVQWTVPGLGSSPLAKAFMRGIDTNTDVAVQLPWNFGLFLDEIPKRLGLNPALDAAANALVNIYARTCNPQNIAAHTASLSSYATAISALRRCLSDARFATSPETLAAINILIVFETLSGRETTRLMQHAGGATRIYKLRGFAPSGDALEEQLLLSMRGPVTIFSMFLGSDYFSDEEWKQLTAHDAATGNSEEMAFRSFANYARFFQQARHRIKTDSSKAKSSDPPVPTFKHLLVKSYEELLQLRVYTDQLRERCSRVSEAFYSYTEAKASDKSTGKGGNGLNTELVIHDYDPDVPLKLLHAHMARSLALALGTEIILGILILALLQQLEPYSDAEIVSIAEKTASLACQHCQLGFEIISVVLKVSDYRPLGTIYVPLTLRFAHAAFLSHPDEVQRLVDSEQSLAGSEELLRILLMSYEMEFQTLNTHSSVETPLILGSQEDEQLILRTRALNKLLWLEPFPAQHAAANKEQLATEPRVDE